MSAALWGIPDLGPPATADDLVAQAHGLGFPATRRLVTSWTEAGLLCSPSFQKRTRHGSASRLYPSAQRQLFLILLHIRNHFSPSQRRMLWRTLVGNVVWIWMHQLLPLPTRQARRALRTYAEVESKVSFAAARRGLREVVDAVAHPSVPKRQYRKAIAVVEQAFRARDWDWDLIASALTEVCSPWPAPPGQRVERGLFAWDERPFGVPEVIQAWRTGVEVSAALRTESVGERELDIARQRYVLRHGEEDLRIVSASIDGYLETAHSPIDRAVGLLLLEVGQVIARSAGSEHSKGGGRADPAP